MRLLKTHSHTSERLGYEARKNAKKSRKTQALRMIRQTTVNILPRTTSVAGGRDGERRLKENAGAVTRETNVKTLPRTASVVGGKTKRRKPTRNGKVAQPTVPRRGELPS